MTKPKLNSRKVKRRYLYCFFTRLLNILVSGLALLMFSPIIIYFAYRIHKEDKGPIFYSQIRIGKDEKPFKIWKLRSMVSNAEQLQKELESKNEIKGAMFKIKDDPRITKVGRKLRKYSLDELPQLWNVLIGDMALVGPRPPLPSEVKKYSDYDKLRLTVKPGCTGLWQVTKRNEANFDEMVELDIEYINRSNLFYDLSIICKTIGIMICPNGAY